MKKRVLYLLCMAFAMMAWLPPQLWAQTQPSGGDGSSESPFLITTAEELQWYANYVNGESGDNVVHTTACAQLVNNIDLSTVCGEGKGNWTPIAKYGIYQYNGEHHFDGVFDGNGHTISNLYINDENGSKFRAFWIHTANRIKNICQKFEDGQRSNSWRKLYCRRVWFGQWCHV